MSTYLADGGEAASRTETGEGGGATLLAATNLSEDAVSHNPPVAAARPRGERSGAREGGMPAETTEGVETADDAAVPARGGTLNRALAGESAGGERGRESGGPAGGCRGIMDGTSSFGYTETSPELEQESLRTTGVGDGEGSGSGTRQTGATTPVQVASSGHATVAAADPGCAALCFVGLQNDASGSTEMELRPRQLNGTDERNHDQHQEDDPERKESGTTLQQMNSSSSTIAGLASSAASIESENAAADQTRDYESRTVVYVARELPLVQESSNTAMREQDEAVGAAAGGRIVVVQLPGESELPLVQERSNTAMREQHEAVGAAEGGRIVDVHLPGERIEPPWADGAPARAAGEAEAHQQQPPLSDAASVAAVTNFDRFEGATQTATGTLIPHEIERQAAGTATETGSAAAPVTVGLEPGEERRQPRATLSTWRRAAVVRFATAVTSRQRENEGDERVTPRAEHVGGGLGAGGQTARAVDEAPAARAAPGREVGGVPQLERRAPGDGEEEHPASHNSEIFKPYFWVTLLPLVHLLQLLLHIVLYLRGPSRVRSALEIAHIRLSSASSRSRSRNRSSSRARRRERERNWSRRSRSRSTDSSGSRRARRGQRLRRTASRERRGVGPPPAPPPVDVRRRLMLARLVALGRICWNMLGGLNREVKSIFVMLRQYFSVLVPFARQVLIQHTCPHRRTAVYQAHAVAAAFRKCRRAPLPECRCFILHDQGPPTQEAVLQRAVEDVLEVQGRNQRGRFSGRRHGLQLTNSFSPPAGDFGRFSATAHEQQRHPQQQHSLRHEHRFQHRHLQQQQQHLQQQSASHRYGIQGSHWEGQDFYIRRADEFPFEDYNNWRRWTAAHPLPWGRRNHSSQGRSTTVAAAQPYDEGSRASSTYHQTEESRIPQVVVGNYPTTYRHWGPAGAHDRLTEDSPCAALFDEDEEDDDLQMVPVALYPLPPVCPGVPSPLLPLSAVGPAAQGTAETVSGLRTQGRGAENNTHEGRGAAEEEDVLTPEEAALAADTVKICDVQLREELREPLRDDVVAESRCRRAAQEAFDAIYSGKVLFRVRQRLQLWTACIQRVTTLLSSAEKATYAEPPVLELLDAPSMQFTIRHQADLVSGFSSSGGRVRAVTGLPAAETTPTTVDGRRVNSGRSGEGRQHQMSQYEQHLQGLERHRTAESRNHENTNEGPDISRSSPPVQTDITSMVRSSSLFHSLNSNTRGTQRNTNGSSNGRQGHPAELSRDLYSTHMHQQAITETPPVMSTGGVRRSEAVILQAVRAEPFGLLRQFLPVDAVRTAGATGLHAHLLWWRWWPAAAAAAAGARSGPGALQTASDRRVNAGRRVALRETLLNYQEVDDDQRTEIVVAEEEEIGSEATTLNPYSDSSLTGAEPPSEEATRNNSERQIPRPGYLQNWIKRGMLVCCSARAPGPWPVLLDQRTLWISKSCAVGYSVKRQCCGGMGVIESYARSRERLLYRLLIRSVCLLPLRAITPDEDEEENGPRVATMESIRRAAREEAELAAAVAPHVRSLQLEDRYTGQDPSGRGEDFRDLCILRFDRGILQRRIAAGRPLEGGRITGRAGTTPSITALEWVTLCKGSVCLPYVSQKYHRCCLCTLNLHKNLKHPPRAAYTPLLGGGAALLLHDSENPGPELPKLQHMQRVVGLRQRSMLWDYCLRLVKDTPKIFWKLNYALRCCKMLFIAWLNRAHRPAALPDGTVPTTPGGGASTQQTNHERRNDGLQSPTRRRFQAGEARQRQIQRRVLLPEPRELEEQQRREFFDDIRGRRRAFFYKTPFQRCSCYMLLPTKTALRESAAAAILLFETATNAGTLPRTSTPARATSVLTNNNSNRNRNGSHVDQIWDRSQARHVTLSDTTSRGNSARGGTVNVTTSDYMEDLFVWERGAPRFARPAALYLNNRDGQTHLFGSDRPLRALATFGERGGEQARLSMERSLAKVFFNTWLRQQREHLARLPLHVHTPHCILGLSGPPTCLHDIDEAYCHQLAVWGAGPTYLFDEERQRQQQEDEQRPLRQDYQQHGQLRGGEARSGNRGLRSSAAPHAFAPAAQGATTLRRTAGTLATTTAEAAEAERVDGEHSSLLGDINFRGYGERTGAQARLLQQRKEELELMEENKVLIDGDDIDTLDSLDAQGAERLPFSRRNGLNGGVLHGLLAGGWRHELTYRLNVDAPLLAMGITPPNRGEGSQQTNAGGGGREEEEVQPPLECLYELLGILHRAKSALQAFCTLHACNPLAVPLSSSTNSAGSEQQRAGTASTQVRRGGSRRRRERGGSRLTERQVLPLMDIYGDERLLPRKAGRRGWRTTDGQAVQTTWWQEHQRDMRKLFRTFFFACVLSRRRLRAAIRRFVAQQGRATEQQQKILLELLCQDAAGWTDIFTTGSEVEQSVAADIIAAEREETQEAMRTGQDVYGRRNQPHWLMRALTNYFRHLLLCARSMACSRRRNIRRLPIYRPLTVQLQQRREGAAPQQQGENVQDVNDDVIGLLTDADETVDVATSTPQSTVDSGGAAATAGREADFERMEDGVQDGGSVEEDSNARERREEERRAELFATAHTDGRLIAVGVQLEGSAVADVVESRRTAPLRLEKGNEEYEYSAHPIAVAARDNMLLFLRLLLVEDSTASAYTGWKDVLRRSSSRELLQLMGFKVYQRMRAVVQRDRLVERDRGEEGAQQLQQRPLTDRHPYHTGYNTTNDEAQRLNEARAANLRQHQALLRCVGRGGMAFFGNCSTPHQCQSGASLQAENVRMCDVYCDRQSPCRHCSLPWLCGRAYGVSEDLGNGSTILHFAARFGNLNILRLVMYEISSTSWWKCMLKRNNANLRPLDVAERWHGRGSPTALAFADATKWAKETVLLPPIACVAEQLLEWEVFNRLHLEDDVLHYVVDLQARRRQSGTVGIRPRRAATPVEPAVTQEHRPAPDGGTEGSNNDGERGNGGSGREGNGEDGENTGEDGTGDGEDGRGGGGGAAGGGDGRDGREGGGDGRGGDERDGRGGGGAAGGGDGRGGGGDGRGGDGRDGRGGGGGAAGGGEGGGGDGRGGGKDGRGRGGDGSGGGGESRRGDGWNGGDVDISKEGEGRRGDERGEEDGTRRGGEQGGEGGIGREGENGGGRGGDARGREEFAVREEGAEGRRDRERRGEEIELLGHRRGGGEGREGSIIEDGHGTGGGDIERSGGIERRAEGEGNTGQGGGMTTEERREREEMERGRGEIILEGSGRGGGEEEEGREGSIIGDGYGTGRGDVERSGDIERREDGEGNTGQGGGMTTEERREGDMGRRDTIGRDQGREREVIERRGGRYTRQRDSIGREVGREGERREGGNIGDYSGRRTRVENNIDEDDVRNRENYNSNWCRDNIEIHIHRERVDEGGEMSSTIGIRNSTPDVDNSPTEWDVNDDEEMEEEIGNFNISDWSRTTTPTRTRSRSRSRESMYGGRSNSHPGNLLIQPQMNIDRLPPPMDTYQHPWITESGVSGSRPESSCTERRVGGLRPVRTDFLNRSTSQAIDMQSTSNSSSQPRQSRGTDGEPRRRRSSSSGRDFLYRLIDGPFPSSNGDRAPQYQDMYATLRSSSGRTSQYQDMYDELEITHSRRRPRSAQHIHGEFGSRSSSRSSSQIHGLYGELQNSSSYNRLVEDHSIRTELISDRSRPSQYQDMHDQPRRRSSGAYEYPYIHSEVEDTSRSRRSQYQDIYGAARNTSSNNSRRPPRYPDVYGEPVSGGSSRRRLTLEYPDLYGEVEGVTSSNRPLRYHDIYSELRSTSRRSTLSQDEGIFDGLLRISSVSNLVQYRDTHGELRSSGSSSRLVGYQYIYDGLRSSSDSSRVLNYQDIRARLRSSTDRRLEKNHDMNDEISSRNSRPVQDAQRNGGYDNGGEAGGGGQCTQEEPPPGVPPHSSSGRTLRRKRRGRRGRAGKQRPGPTFEFVGPEPGSGTSGGTASTPHYCPIRRAAGAAALAAAHFRGEDAHVDTQEEDMLLKIPEATATATETAPAATTTAIATAIPEPRERTTATETETTESLTAPSTTVEATTTEITQQVAATSTATETTTPTLTTTHTTTSTTETTGTGTGGRGTTGTETTETVTPTQTTTGATAAITTGTTTAGTMETTTEISTTMQQ